MNDTQITVTGWVGSPVELREAAGVAVTDFRVACTPRRFDRKSQEWVNGTNGLTQFWIAFHDCLKAVRFGNN